MTVKLNSNTSSLRAQRALQEHSDVLGRIYERLASGQRINRAADDAAGLAIAESLSADRRVFSQGVRNLSDGVSLLQIADSALSELSAITIRIRELAEQAANGTYSVRQRWALDQEAQQLSDEFTRIVNSTEFNGVGILAGELGTLRLQAGYGVEGSIADGVGGARGTGSFSATVSTSISALSTEFQVGDLNSDGNEDFVSVADSIGYVSVFLGRGDGTFATEKNYYSLGGDPTSIALADVNSDGVLDIVNSMVVAGDVSSVMLGNGDGTFRTARTAGPGTVNPTDLSLADFNGDGTADYVVVSSGGAIVTALGNGNGTFTLGGNYTSALSFNNVIAADMNSDGAMDVIASSGTTAYVYLGNGDGTLRAPTTKGMGSGALNEIIVEDVNGDGILDLLGASNSSIGVALGLGNGTFATAITSPQGGAAISIAAIDVNADGLLDAITSDGAGVRIRLGNGNGTFAIGTIHSFSAAPVDISVADFNNDGVSDFLAMTNNGYASYRANTVDGVHPLLPFSLTSAAEARKAMSNMDKKLVLLSAQRAEIGAFEQRLNTAGAVLDAQSLEYATAQSRIRDVDIAATSADLVRTQILQQAAAAILAQANQQPTLVLRLLEGT